MAMSRTARILVAILLLAAAAFFWVNFYTQNRTAETPATDPAASDGVAVPPATTPAATEPASAVAEGDDAAPSDAAATPAEPGGEPTAEVDATPSTEEPTDLDAVVVAPIVGEPGDGPPTVVVDAPVAVGREIVVADLPFLVTEPRPLAVDEELDTEEVAQAVPVRGVTVPTRATVNPFSPVVVRVPPAPERDIPAADRAVTEVAVPAAPTPAEAAAAAAAARASAPTPRAVAPAPVGETAGLRPLPTGTVLSSTPSLLREPRAATAAAPVEVPPVVAVAVPDVEATVPGTDPVAGNPTASTPSNVDPEPLGAPSAAGPASDAAATADATTDQPGAVASPDAAATPPTPADPPPLAAGASSLARFLRDGNYAFTGSVVGPISVGVFRSDRDATPLVVAIGQTLPDTDIVLTDLRGQQAELRLGDSTQILTLDLRR
jgi:hypothetical protein